MNEIIKDLYNTNAFEVNVEQPFWYTSGQIGPYFFNIQNLVGGKETADKILEFINNNIKSETLQRDLFELLNALYMNNRMYRNVIISLAEKIRGIEKLNPNMKVDYISGGERRDWLFSLMVAHILMREHLSIYKDGHVVSTDMYAQDSVVLKDKKELENCIIFHVADILNVGSSFTDNWIPSINIYGGEIKCALPIFDRLDGGTDTLEDNYRIHVVPLINMNQEFIEASKDCGYITPKQCSIISSYKENPIETMKNFLKEHPNFIKNALNSKDKKIRERAFKCMEKGYYKEKQHTID